MMSLKVIGSSSKGNTYVLSTSDTTILLDCGVSKLQDKIDVDKIDGILITHRHL